MAEILVGKDTTQCEQWTGTAVVVDVLRCSTTLCALTAHGKKDIRVYGSKEKALAYRAARPNIDFFSELEYKPPIEKYDNSPYQVLTLSDRNKPAVVVTGAGTKAMTSLHHAGRILVGCFANLPYVAGYIKTLPEDVLVVPAGLFFLDHPEDRFCAETIKSAAEGVDTSAAAIKKLWDIGRAQEFIDMRKTGKEDLNIAFTVGGLKVIPEVKLHGDHGTVVNIYRG